MVSVVFSLPKGREELETHRFSSQHTLTCHFGNPACDAVGSGLDGIVGEVGVPSAPMNPHHTHGRHRLLRRAAQELRQPFGR